MKLINIGKGNLINIDRVISLTSPDAAPIKRLIADAKKAGTLIDSTCGKKTKTVIIHDSGHITLSALTAEAIEERTGKES